MNEAGGEPKQSFEVVPAPEADESAKAPIEKQPAQETSAGKPAAPASIQPPVVLPDVPTPVMSTQDDDQIAMPVVSPKTSKLPAADKDRIEKQWVQKAKEIVAETKSDPYKQKSEMSKAKADYIQKRFKKTLKTDDTVTA